MDKESEFMEYLGYRGEIQYGEADRVYFGSILGITDMVIFEGDNVKVLRKNLHEAVDDYLGTCRRHGKQPQKPGYP